MPFFGSCVVSARAHSIDTTPFRLSGNHDSLLADFHCLRSSVLQAAVTTRGLFPTGEQGSYLHIEQRPQGRCRGCHVQCRVSRDPDSAEKMRTRLLPNGALPRPAAGWECGPRRTAPLQQPPAKIARRVRHQVIGDHRQRRKRNPSDYWQSINGLRKRVPRERQRQHRKEQDDLSRNDWRRPWHSQILDEALSRRAFSSKSAASRSSRCFSSHAAVAIELRGGSGIYSLTQKTSCGLPWRLLPASGTGYLVVSLAKQSNSGGSARSSDGRVGLQDFQPVRLG